MSLQFLNEVWSNLIYRPLISLINYRSLLLVSDINVKSLHRDFFLFLESCTEVCSWCAKFSSIARTFWTCSFSAWFSCHGSSRSFLELRLLSRLNFRFRLLRCLSWSNSTFRPRVERRLFCWIIKWLHTLVVSDCVLLVFFFQRIVFKFGFRFPNRWVVIVWRWWDSPGNRLISYTRCLLALFQNRFNRILHSRF